MVWETGGAAFPSAKVVIEGDKWKQINLDGGMTLRDYMAAAALTGLLANESRRAAWETSTADAYAKGTTEQAYMMADAMLVAKEG